VRLADRHRAHGARFGELGGRPVVLGYAAGRDAEVRAVREAVGLIDLSHLGTFEVTGPDRNAFVNRIACNDVAALESGRVQFSALLNERGGFLDEITVLRFDERLLLVVNAENADRAWTHIVEQKRGTNVRLRDVGIATGHLGIEGPGTEALLQPFCDRALAALPFRGVIRATVAGCDVFCARQSYSGEDGIELLCRDRDLPVLWDALVGAGAAPFGLDARDLLRLEMGYVAWARELDDATLPAEAGLGWIAPLGKGAPYIGEGALKLAAQRGLLRRLVGLRPDDPHAALAAGDEVRARGRAVGQLCSVGTSSYAGGTIATAYVAPGQHEPGTPLLVVHDGLEVPATVVARPFIGARSRRP
jgi:aminomethyltransferase